MEKLRKALNLPEDLKWGEAFDPEAQARRREEQKKVRRDGSGGGPEGGRSRMPRVGGGKELGGMGSLSAPEEIQRLPHSLGPTLVPGRC
jgi:hypothetical protein